jgi:hypothetical protein
MHILLHSGSFTKHSCPIVLNILLFHMQDYIQNVAMAAGGKDARHGEVWCIYQTYLLKREKTLPVRNLNIVRNILMKRKASHFMNLYNPFIAKCLIVHVAYTSRFWDNFTIPRVTLELNQYFYIAMFNLKSSVFWNITLCSPVKADWCFRGPYCLSFHAGSLLGLLLNPEDGGTICFRNVSWLGHMMLYLRR